MAKMRGGVGGSFAQTYISEYIHICVLYKYVRRDIHTHAFKCCNRPILYIIPSAVHYTYSTILDTVQ